MVRKAEYATAPKKRPTGGRRPPPAVAPSDDAYRPAILDLLETIERYLITAVRRLCKGFHWTREAAFDFPVEELADELDWLNRAEYEDYLSGISRMETAFVRAQVRLNNKGHLLEPLPSWDQTQRQQAEPSAADDEDGWDDPYGGTVPDYLRRVPDAPPESPYGPTPTNGVSGEDSGATRIPTEAPAQPTEAS